MESDEREDAKCGYQGLGVEEHHNAGGEPRDAEKDAGPHDPFAEGGLGAPRRNESSRVRCCWSPDMIRACLRSTVI